MPKETRPRTAIAEDWTPSEKDVAYATSKGLDAQLLVEPFVCYHGARGSLMASWPLAWRTWCQTEAVHGYNKAKLKPVVDANDPYGADAWAATLTDTVPDTVEGRVVPTLGGYDAAGVARDVCQAAGLPAEWRGDLKAIGDWLRAGVEPAHMLAVIGRGRGPRTAGSWRYYDKVMKGES